MQGAKDTTSPGSSDPGSCHWSSDRRAPNWATLFPLPDPEILAGMGGSGQDAVGRSRGQDLGCHHPSLSRLSCPWQSLLDHVEHLPAPLPQMHLLPVPMTLSSIEELLPPGLELEAMPSVWGFARGWSCPFYLAYPGPRWN